ncbi:MAG TPA: hypothetical protein VMR62_10180 [Bryobacteraceae bacterium]|jgi:hypothetical protein|nr:hypothetical protein [Bryobacteraceae bacterium]
MTAGQAKLEDLAARLRAQVSERRYREAQEALDEYCRVLRQTAAALPRGNLRRLQDEWRRLAEETRRQVLAGRAHAGARLAKLAQLSQGSRFYGAARDTRRTREWLA